MKPATPLSPSTSYTWEKCESGAAISERSHFNTWQPHLNTWQRLHETMGILEQNKRLTKRERLTGVKKPTGWRTWRVQCGLAWPPQISIQGNILHLTISPNQGNPHKERIPQDTCIYENLPYKERPSPPRNGCQLYATIKTSKPSQTKVCIILSQLWHSRVAKVL